MLLLDVGLAALGSSRALNRLAVRDTELVARVSAADQTFAQVVARHEDLARERLRALRRRLTVALVSMTSAALVAMASNQLAFVRFTGAQLGVASAFVFAWAGLSRLSWQEGSYKGTTTIERADTAIFNGMCWVGMYLAVLAVM